ncbi:T9SS type B sorting domain-containing protein [Salinimicrobium sp. HB62]|uniref:T9SS type B sorting domain-containing protein n=1 Tax=Salinimicrobium sp. HB62 TaxID=3077781 RepID=UPI002D77097D|nr:T9SS type B sorting domain-containing protein [Salinimicrobium sp. HB62]
MRHLFLFLTCLLIFGQSRSQELLWEKTIGGDGADWFHHAFQDSRGNYFFSGYSYSSASGDKTVPNHLSGDSDSWIVETDTDGNILWQQTFGGYSQDMIMKVIEMADGTFLLAGYSYSGASGDKTEALRGFRDLWLVKLDQNREIQWQRTYGGNDAEDLNDIVVTSDGGFLLTSTSNSIASGDKTTAAMGNSDIWILKLDSLGRLEWQKSYGGSGHDHDAQIEKKNNGNFLIAATSSSGVSATKTEDSKGLGDYWVFEIDPQGEIIWQRTIGGNNGEYLTDLQETRDGGYFLGGDSSSEISGDKTMSSKGFIDLWVVKINSSGDILWQQTYGGNSTEWLSSFHPAPDGGYMIAAMSGSDPGFDKTEPNRGDRDFWVFHISEEGEKCWDKTIGGNSTDQPMYGFVDLEGNYVMAGWTDSGASGDKTENSRGGRDGWVVKIKPLEIVPPSVNTPDPYIACDENGDGFAEFDLSDLHRDIAGDQTDLEITYFDAEGNLLPSPLPDKFTNTIKGNQVITARISTVNNSCSSVTIEFTLALDNSCKKPGGSGKAPDFRLYFPEFFTPNSDGHNDDWGPLTDKAGNIKVVEIYDRYGKLLKKLAPGETWNGVYNGNEMPVDDYWFTAITSKNDILKGHFSLLR